MLSKERPDSPGPKRRRSSCAFSASLIETRMGLFGKPRTLPPLIIEAEIGSRMLGIFGRSERCGLPVLGLDAPFTLAAMIGGSGP